MTVSIHFFLTFKRGHTNSFCEYVHDDDTDAHFLHCLAIAARTAESGVFFRLILLALPTADTAWAAERKAPFIPSMRSISPPTPPIDVLVEAKYSPRHT
jgi:hypothetical protein